LLHQVGDLFELNVKLRCQKVKHHARTTYDRHPWRYNLTHYSHQYQTVLNCQLPAPAALQGGKGPRYLLDKWLSRPKSWFGCCR